MAIPFINLHLKIVCPANFAQIRMCGGLRLILNCLDRAMSATSENLEYWRANIQAAERVLKMLGYLGQFNEKVGWPWSPWSDEFVLGRYTQTKFHWSKKLGWTFWTCWCAEFHAERIPPWKLGWLLVFTVPRADSFRTIFVASYAFLWAHCAEVQSKMMTWRAKCQVKWGWHSTLDLYVWELGNAELFGIIS